MASAVTSVAVARALPATELTGVMLGCISGALQWLQYRHAQAGGLLFLPVHHFLFLYCLCLAVGGPEPKPDSDRKLGVLQLPCADFDTFLSKFPNYLNTRSLVTKPSQQVSQCAFQSGGRIPSGFRLILNAAFKTYKCLTVARSAVLKLPRRWGTWCSLQ